MTDFPWVSVCGYGAHIKSTQKTLTIQKKRDTQEYDLDSVKHLLIVGGHTIHSSTINNLVKKGAFISFFDADGTHIGTIRPNGDETSLALHELQRGIPRQKYAVAIAQASIKARIIAIELAEEQRESALLYEGELDILHKSLDEIGYLIKLDEIRRLHRLTSDMYYEIMARRLPPELQFRRRTARPQIDPVNAMLSFGYAMLFGTCSVSVIGAHLNPDIGFMHDGRGSLVSDLIEPLKPNMIDAFVFRTGQNLSMAGDFECTEGRCLLSDELIKTMMRSFFTSMNTMKINEQVHGILNAIRDNVEFTIQY